MARRFRILLGTIALGLSLTACGGGGGIATGTTNFRLLLGKTRSRRLLFLHHLGFD